MKHLIPLLAALSIITIGVLSVVLLLVRPISPFLVYLTLFTFSTLIALIIAWAFQQFLSFAANIVNKSMNSGKAAKLLGLGAASLLLFDVPNQFINTFITFSYRFVYNIASNFGDTWSQNLRYFCDPTYMPTAVFSNTTPLDPPSLPLTLSNFYDLETRLGEFGRTLTSNCLSEMVIAIPRIWSNSFADASFSANLSDLPYDQLLLFIAVWVILTIIVDRCRPQRSANSFWATIVRISSNPIIISNAMFFIILGIGLYLSVASIAAIPSLQDLPEGPPEIIKDLQGEFDVIIAQFAQEYPSEGDEQTLAKNPFTPLAGGNPFDAIQTLLDDATIIDSRAMTPTTQVDTQIDTEASADGDVGAAGESIFVDIYIHQQVKTKLDEYAYKRQTIIGSGQEMPSSILAELQRLARDAATKYEISSLTRIGDRETGEHFVILTRWFNYHYSSLTFGVSRCVESIQTLDSNFQKWSRMEVDNLTLASQSSIGYQRSDAAYDLDWDIDNAIFFATQDCYYQNSAMGDNAPERPELGDYLGPFGLLVSWLLPTESLPLALITGLIGFGLLGAACSTFVRERLDTPAPQRVTGPLVADLPKIIVIGLSAAILAFLATMGGLAVFFTDGTEPNPYALLLGCLVAAVFAETVWQWAKDRFSQNLSADQRKGETTPKDEGQMQSEDNVAVPHTHFV